MEWTRGPAIGRGATATVYIAAEKRSGELIAVKSAELARCASLRNEQSLLSKLACPRIVKYLGFSLTTEDDTPIYNLAIEYVPGGTLFDAVRRNGKLDEPSIRLYTRQILQGLDYLHQNSIAHCDVKTRNVLVGHDGAKIADLGCARFVGGPGPPCFSGTPAYMAPEVARGERQGFEADVWAVGCAVIEMATGSGPWPDATAGQAVSALYRIGYSDAVPEAPGPLSAEGKDFLGKCLRREWEQRWTVKELLEHPFLRSPERDFEAETASPSSVLDKGLWDLSVEASEASQRELEVDFEECSVSDSARERIEVLSGSESFDDDDEEEEDWLTIRVNESQGQETNETSMVNVDREEEVDGFGRFMLCQELSFELSFEINSQANGVFSHYTSFAITRNKTIQTYHVKTTINTFLFIPQVFLLFTFFFY